jgi:hypothetical protein
MKRKRKMQHTGAQGSKRFHEGSSSQGPVFHPGRQQRMQAATQGFQTPQCQIQRPNFQTSRSVPPPPQRNNNAHNSSVMGLCYNYGQTWHYANRCPRKQANQTLSLATQPEPQSQC